MLLNNRICRRKFVYSFIVLFLFLINSYSFAQINRKALVTRHTVLNTGIDSLSSLSVGNGNFAFTVDVTGLQSFPDYYSGGVPLGTQSYWGWDSYPNTEGFAFDETLERYQQNGREVSYAVQRKEPRPAAAVNYFRSNPHRLQLGNLGFEITKKDGQPATPSDLSNIRQTLNMWTGEIESYFEVEGIPVQVSTICYQKKDIIGVSVKSPLLARNRLKVRVRIPYPTGGWEDRGIEWKGERNYTSMLKNVTDRGATIQRTMDSIQYTIGLTWEPNAKIKEKKDHYFLIEPAGGNEFSFTCQFSPEGVNRSISVSGVRESSKKGWKTFWESGGVVDFSKCTDPRAQELERRVVLSQYLTKLQCSSFMPPQETGLTYNSWYGKPHLEMHWWHGVHFPLWGRARLLENSMHWYNEVFDEGRKLAKRQGFRGVRWQKMTDPGGKEGPSSVGAFLIWQQPHFITYAELLYRNNPSQKILEKYKQRVYETADFMVSFGNYNEEKKRYELGPPVIPAQERFPKTQTYNPTYELAYWNWALHTALEWKNRLGEKQPEEWVKVVENLSPLPVQKNVYLATEIATDSYTNPAYLTDHPSVLGTFGMLPETTMLNKQTMENTFDKVWTIWEWEDTWGWDFPMTAMTAARLGKPEKAVDALLMDVQTNTYLPNGHNYQEDRLTIYLPGNGGLLTAVAMMCAGWDGSEGENPGFPSNGKWNVEWEDLQKMP